MASRIRPFYNVDHPVGRGKSNKTDDVMLVQFFLTEIASKNPSLPPWNRPTTALAVNGNFDDNMHNWILTYQQGVKSVGSPIHPDGIVDSDPGFSSQRSTNTHSLYTIVFLNNQYKGFFPDTFHKLFEDPKVPLALRTALFNNAK